MVGRFVGDAAERHVNSIFSVILGVAVRGRKRDRGVSVCVGRVTSIERPRRAVRGR